MMKCKIKSMNDKIAISQVRFTSETGELLGSFGNFKEASDRVKFLLTADSHPLVFYTLIWVDAVRFTGSFLTGPVNDNMDFTTIIKADVSNLLVQGIDRQKVVMFYQIEEITPERLKTSDLFRAFSNEAIVKGFDSARLADSFLKSSIEVLEAFIKGAREDRSGEPIAYEQEVHFPENISVVHHKEYLQISDGDVSFSVLGPMRSLEEIKEEILAYKREIVDAHKPVE